MQRAWNVVIRAGAAALLSIPVTGIGQVPPSTGRPGMEWPPVSIAPGRQGFPPMHGPIGGGFGPDGPKMLPPEQPLLGSDPTGALRHPLLRGLKLDEAQADKVFEILHAQTPAVPSATKALRKANDDLRTLALSEAYDGAKARLLADAVSRASDELVLLRADADHKIWNVLTSEQRRQVEVLQRPARKLDQ